MSSNIGFVNKKNVSFAFDFLTIGYPSTIREAEAATKLLVEDLNNNKTSFDDRSNSDN